MVTTPEFESLLKTGVWETNHARSRSKSPRPPEPRSPVPPVHRANQSSKIRHVPRSFDLIHRYPPPPSVEDEADALAKEHGGSVVSMSSAADEEPPYRGDLEQNPILLPVHEHNPERRFVHVGAGSPDSDAESNAGGARLQGKEEYEANTCRKFTMPSRSGDKPSDKSSEFDDQSTLGVKTERSRRRSELPRIQTGLGSNAPSRNPSRNPSQASSPTVQRTRSATYLDQPVDGYFDRLDSQAPPQSAGYLSPGPAIIKHATKGRDRAYIDFSGNPTGSDRRGQSTIVHNSRAGPDERGERRSAAGYDRIPHPSDSSAHKRSSSAVETPKPTRRSTDTRRDKQYRDGYRDEGSDPRSSSSRKKSDSPSPPSRYERRNQSPSRSNRGASPPLRSYSQRDKLTRGNSTRKSRDSPPRDYEESSGDEYSKSRRSTRDKRDRRKSFVIQDDPNYLLSPDSSHPAMIGRPKSRQGTPLPSPRASQTGFDAPPPSPRHGSTFPLTREPKERERRRGEDRSVSPFSPGPGSSPPPKSRASATASKEEPPRRPDHTRMPSLNVSTSSPAVMATALGGAASAAAAAAFMGAPHIADMIDTPVQRRRSPLPQPVAPRKDLPVDTMSGQQPNWQPGNFTPPSSQNGQLDQPIVSYRRYSEDVSQGRAADLPACPRQHPQAGFSDWLTFPLSKNFNICPDCYSAVFGRTEFAHSFVPAPFRPMDKPIACDFGSSPWYRIAWLMTRKGRLPDLQLLQKMSTVDAQHQPCGGGQRMLRVWQTIRNPTDNRPVENFSVCSYCANSVQILFPNLSGTFQPLDPKAARAEGVCSLHFAPERRRFLLYFDVLEETSDRALSRKSSPDVSRLYERLRRVSLSGCTRDQPLYDRKWYMMRNLDDLKVCEECFEHAVQPEIEANNPLARNFYKQPQRERGVASCQLYSPRMREVFYQACRRNDLAMLGWAVRDRLDAEADIKDRIARCMAHNSTGTFDEKIESLQMEWLAKE